VPEAAPLADTEMPDLAAQVRALKNAVVELERRIADRGAGDPSGEA
jgi:hypothetical protein